MSQADEPLMPGPQGEGDPIWQHLFDDAAELPPPRVWAAIERRLEQEEDFVPVIPFWNRPTVWRWGVAAALTLLMLGWWSVYFITSPTPQAIHKANPSQVASASGEALSNVPQQASSPKALAQDTHNPQSSTPGSKGILQQEALATTQLTNLPAGADATTPTQLPTPRPEHIDSYQPEPIVSATAEKTNKSPSKATPALQPPALPRVVTRLTPTANNLPPVDLASLSEPGRFSTDLPSSEKNNPVSDLAVLVNPLETRPMKLPTHYGTQRVVWFNPERQPESPENKKNRQIKSERWVSVSVMPSSFNPAVALAPNRLAYANALVKSSAPAAGPAPTLNSRADFSLAYQVSSGLQLGGRWSVETGLGYLAARSSVNSPLQTSANALVASSPLRDLYSQALVNSRTSAGGLSFSAAPTPSNNFTNGNARDQLLAPSLYDETRPQLVSNNYTFVQLPVQLGYQLRPRKQLGIVALGGLLTNLFLNNTVNNQLSITQQDKVYRPLTLSAATGLRFQYRPTRQWSASMAGTFQQSLQRGTRTGTDLTTRPQTLGVSAGLNYHF